VVPSVLIPLLLIITLLLGVALIVAGMLKTVIVRHRRARDKAHILRRVADLEEHKR
jgi:heme/copper-type cytochrome/quinol oxidase subunit 2